MSRRVKIPAAVGGLNTRDQFDTMSPYDCVALQNLYPKGTWLESRESITLNFPLQNSEGIVEYPAVDENILFASGTSVYEIGNETAIYTGLTSGRLVSCFYKNYSFIVNGTANIYSYDGTDFDLYTDFTGIAVGDLITNTFISKDRVWFVYKATDGSSGVYYGDLGAISGALGKLPLNFVGGGVCIMGGNFSQDSGVGLDDMTYFISNNGDVLIYTGIDFGVSPDDPFRLIQNFSISKPLGNRATENVNADVLVMTQNGLESLARNLAADRANIAPISDKINRFISQLTGQFDSYGWDLKYFKKMGCLWLSTPTGNSYILNIKDPTPKGEFAWTSFDINCNALGVYNNDLYFTNLSGFYKYGGYNGDDTGSGSQTILCALEQAPNDLGYQDEKQFLALKPYFESQSTIEYQTAVIVDFERQERYYTPDYQPLSGTAWNTTPWNSFSWYVGDTVNSQPRDLIAKTGVRLSLGIRFEAKQKVKILSNEILVELGQQWK